MDGPISARIGQAKTALGEGLPMGAVARALSGDESYDRSAEHQGRGQFGCLAGKVAARIDQRKVPATGRNRQSAGAAVVFGSGCDCNKHGGQVWPEGSLNAASGHKQMLSHIALGPDGRRRIAQNGHRQLVALPFYGKLAQKLVHLAFVFQINNQSTTALLHGDAQIGRQRLGTKQRHKAFHLRFVN